jgi:Flp pilus assembly protein TadG
MRAPTLLRRLARDQGGATAIEFALTLPLLVMLILGAIWAGLLILTVSSLDYSVQSAARCSAVNVQLCDTAAKTVAYAEKLYTGPTTKPTFTATSDGCGHTVVGTADYDLAILPGIKPTPISVRACYP